MLIMSSGDGTLSVIDVRSKKTEPIAQSEDQEDELLSIVPIKGYAVHPLPPMHPLTLTQRPEVCRWHPTRHTLHLQPPQRLGRRASTASQGIPHSIDTLAPLPAAAYAPVADDLSSRAPPTGLLRAVQLFPTKLLGVVADHGEFPIERIAVDRGGEGRWVGSAGHEEVLKLTDLQEVFADDEEEDVSEGEEKEKVSQKDSEEGDSDAEVESSEEEIVPGLPPASPRKEPAPEAEAEPAADALAAGADSSDDEGIVERKRKRKKENDPLKAEKRSKGRNTVVAEPSFFADL
ncbi:hypothetical protein EVJ58_g7054 [Rhodofomes roseus]|uniref:Uncharacterized protein n=1 Tax=Rhodofomes roseus TaxID=34475 RepID=A0A4Y9Y5J1_9APHY|nr:hypothetical protein EVJ58_g7054 [Rhodofomes roseus]